ncbi:hypothetical protein DCO44_11095 [Acinetobacter sp. AM]|nr:hypothetical protein DCO44_11095 [Acinetobacter sp. AM]
MLLFFNALSSFSLGILDIDSFKTFNDFYAHQAGNDVLQQMCKCCKLI